MSATAEVLAEVPLFADLDDRDRAVLAERVDVMPLEVGKMLFQYGDPGDWMVILKSGAVELTVKTKTGEKVFLESIGAGEFFGEISLLDMGARTATATVVEAGEALIVDRGDLDELLRIQPAAAMRLLAATGKRLRNNAEMLRNTASKNVNEVATDQGNIVLRIADWVANFSGSITFLVLHVIFFACWIGFNSTPLAFDAFPYNLLTMTVSLEAIILSTLLLFSGNRSAARDRIRSDIEYEVNLKAELEVAHLHDKTDLMHEEMLERFSKIEKELNISTRQSKPMAAATPETKPTDAGTPT